MFERIVVPLDGSQYGETALPWAADVAAAFGSQVHLLSVTETTTGEDRGLRQGYLDHQADWLKNEIAQRKPPVPAAVLTVVLAGDPAQQIVQYTATNDIRLIILVSHGRSGIMSWPMGSTAARILSTESRPVLFVRARTTAPRNAALAASMLVALDGSTAAEAVLPYVKEMSARLHSRVTLLRAVPESYDIVTIGGTNSIGLPRMQVERLRREAGEYLDTVKARFESAQAVAEVRTGPAATEIIKYAAENDVSLIAISSRGQSQTGSWSFGEVSHKIVNATTAPVLIIRVPNPDH